MWWVRRTHGWGLHAAHRSRLDRIQALEPARRSTRPRCWVHALPARTANPHQASRSIAWRSYDGSGEDRVLLLERLT